jgi:hypothetical protein
VLTSSIVFFLLAAILFTGYSPLLAIAQQPQTGTLPPLPTPTPSLTPTPPLTPQEQEEQNRLQNVIAATNQNLDEAEKEVNGIVYTPRWSNPVWVEANSLAVLFAYCLPGEFAESGQEILGGFELEVLESYEIALAQGFMAWMMVIGNEDRQDRLPAAVGVICASDTNDVETRVLSPQEQQEINNVVQQFITTTQVTTIEQVINIINNITTTTPQQNGTGTTPTTGNNTGTPPTGNGTGGTGGGPFRPIIPDIVGNITVAEADRTAPVLTVPSSYTVTASNQEGIQQYWITQADDNVDGYALLDLAPEGMRLRQDPVGGNVGGDISISCNPPPLSIFPVGVTTVQCTATDASGNTGTASFTIRVNRPPIESPFLAQEQPPPAEEGAAPPAEEPPVVEEEAPVEEQPPATEGGGEDEGAAESPPANDEGGVG